MLGIKFHETENPPHHVRNFVSVMTLIVLNKIYSTTSFREDLTRKALNDTMLWSHARSLVVRTSGRNSSTSIHAILTFAPN